MKRETILKTILVLIIGAILFAIPVNVYAEATDLDSFWEDQGGLDDIGGDTTTEQETPTTTPEPEQTPTTPSTPSTPATPEPEETLPDAGLAEDTLMVVTIAGLVIAAIFAYRKVNEYQNI